MAGILTALMYGLVAWWMAWVCLHYPKLALSLGGVAFHLFIVGIRVLIQQTVPGADGWDWPNIHRATITIAALCALVGGYRLRWWEWG